MRKIPAKSLEVLKKINRFERKDHGAIHLCNFDRGERICIGWLNKHGYVYCRKGENWVSATVKGFCAADNAIKAAA